MPLTIPSYIAGTNIDSMEVKYPWDEWGSKKAIYRREGDDQLKYAATTVSQRGRIALVTGVTEWLVYRFRRLVDSHLPFDALEALWAGQVERKYLLPFDMPEEQGWSGPVNGPIRRALTFAHDAVDIAWENGETTHLVVRTVNLTRYVLPHTEDLELWLLSAIKRIGTVSPWHNDDFMGEVVPREALDYRHDFDPATTELLTRHFLRRLSPNSNPYLASRKTMLDWGFQGDPYTFDIARDREVRRHVIGG